MRRVVAWILLKGNDGGFVMLDETRVLLVSDAILFGSAVARKYGKSYVCDCFLSLSMSRSGLQLRVIRADGRAGNVNLNGDQ